MDFRSSLIIAMIAGASLCGDASAQSLSEDYLSGLIKAVGGRIEQQPDSLDAVTSKTLDIISPKTQDGGSADIGRVLSAMNPVNALVQLATSANRPAEVGGTLSAMSGASSVSVLNYLSHAYEGTGFYQAGYWGKDGSMYSSPSYTGPMPVFDRSDFYRPAWGHITSGFGFRPKFNRVHKGVDISLSVGDTVRAALPGIVGQVNYEPGGYGNYVVLAHSNGVETRYAHLSESLLYPGQQIEAGEPIALGGNTGNSTGPHLHFETRYMGTAIDPTTVFDFTGRSMNLYARASKTDYPTSERIASGLKGTKTSLKQKSTYVLRDGDTVKAIADRAGISVLRLCQLNFITESERLQPGTMLKLR